MRNVIKPSKASTGGPCLSRRANGKDERAENGGETGSMKMVTRRSRNPRKLFSMELRNRVTNKTIAATFYEPQRERKYLKAHRTWIVVWNTRAQIRAGNKVLRDNSLPGATWLTSLMLAIEGLRILIPFEEEDDWLDESDLPSWLVVPKTIQVGWGHDLHKELVGAVNARVASLFQKLTKNGANTKRKTTNPSSGFSL
jgi:hypothetical protein